MDIIIISDFSKNFGSISFVFCHFVQW